MSTKNEKVRLAGGVGDVNCRRRLTGGVPCVGVQPLRLRMPMGERKTIPTVWA